MSIPFEFHGQIIGQKGSFIRQIMEDHEVTLSIPPPSEKLDVIKITGPSKKIDGARKALEDKIHLLEEERADRVRSCVYWSIWDEVSTAMLFRGMKTSPAWWLSLVWGIYDARKKSFCATLFRIVFSISKWYLVSESARTSGEWSETILSWMSTVLWMANQMLIYPNHRLDDGLGLHSTTNSTW